MTKKRRTFLAPSILVVSLYLLSVVLSIPETLINSENYGSYNLLSNEYFFSSIAFIIILLVYLLPIIVFREDKIKFIELPNSWAFELFTFTVLFLSLFSIIYFIPTTIAALTLEDIGAARQALGAGDDFQLVSNTIYNTIAGTTASFYQMPILLSFISFAKGNRKWISYALLISSMSYIFYVFSSIGRDGVVFWIFSFLGIWLFFRNFISERQNKNMRKILIYSTAIGGMGFIIITLGRFSDAPLKSILSYLGSPFPNFCIAYNLDLPVANGLSFPLFRALFGLPEEVNTWQLNMALMQGGTVGYIFGTFLKTLLFSLGKYGTFFLGIAISMLFVPYFRRGNIHKLTFSKLLIYLLFFQIFSQGVFYFRQYNRVGNLVIIVYFIFAFLFHIYAKSSARQKIFSKKIINKC